MTRTRRRKIKTPRNFKFPYYITNCTYTDRQGRHCTLNLNQLSADLHNLSDEKAFARAQDEVTGMAKLIRQNLNGRSYQALLNAPLMKAYAFSHSALVKYGSKKKPHLFPKALDAACALKTKLHVPVSTLISVSEGPK